MNPQEIHARLSAHFGPAIAPWQAPAAGDPRVDTVPASLHAVCEHLRSDPELDFDYLRLVSGVDYTDRLACVYHLCSIGRGHSLTLGVFLDRSAPHLDSVSDLWPAAEWHEREAFDMLGIRFDGHPDLRRILLPEDWAGFPLRKDYQSPESYNGMTNL